MLRYTVELLATMRRSRWITNQASMPTWLFDMQPRTCVHPTCLARTEFIANSTGIAVTPTQLLFFFIRATTNFSDLERNFLNTKLIIMMLHLIRIEYSKHCVVGASGVCLCPLSLTEIRICSIFHWLLIHSFLSSIFMISHPDPFQLLFRLVFPALLALRATLKMYRV